MMGIYAKLLDLEQPKANAHAWPHAFQQYWGGRIPLTTLLDHFSSTITTEEISNVNLATDRYTLPFNYDWTEDDGVYFTTTGTLPAGLALDTIYYILNPNSGTFTTAVSATKAGSAVNVTSQGSGTHSLNLIDPDVMHWDATRKTVTHTGAWDQKVARFTWDQAAEGIVLLSEADFAGYDTVAALKTELEGLANRLSE